ncbi:MAG: bifunctional oligoribonuclease/PAP phosphatase NrnA [Clostridia bacterium]|nr:bifunctional oligoribonuclease/PAP phosphatase NrnA [Clostridia bacterium]
MYENSIIKDIENVQTIYITGHTNPDGDCIGSAFGFALAMARLGKKPVILLEDYAERFNILEGREYVFKGDYSHIEPEIMFSIDCGSKERLGIAESVFERAGYTYNIDHHISNTNFADVNIINGNASSACEVIYEIISRFTDIDKDIATALYTGLLTDTGGFRHNCTSERTHQIAGKLVALGVDTPAIHTRFLMEHSLAEAKIFARAISKMELKNKIAYTYVTKEDMESCGASPKNLDAIVGYLLNTEGAEVSLFASERENNVVKLSFRSKNIDVNAIAALYGGGGHILAAGASAEGNISDILNKTIKEIEKRLG